MELAYYSRQPLSEVQSWSDQELVTMQAVLDEFHAAQKGAHGGR